MSSITKPEHREKPASRLPERLIELIRSCSQNNSPNLPATEFFNECWMLRLLLDAAQSLAVSSPLAFSAQARWYSEALLASPFAPRRRPDPLGEGFTNADGVVGHFSFDPTTKAGLRIRADATQFVVVEAKMFSNLSAGTKNAPAYNQAARNVACMAEALSQCGKPIESYSSLGFFVVAPHISRRAAKSNLEACIAPDAIRYAVHERIRSYELAGRPEADPMRNWERQWFLPLVSRLEQARSIALLSWDDCIASVASADAVAGEELEAFYHRCLSFAPRPATVPDS